MSRFAGQSEERKIPFAGVVAEFGVVALWKEQFLECCLVCCAGCAAVVVVVAPFESVIGRTNEKRVVVSVSTVSCQTGESV